MDIKFCCHPSALGALGMIYNSHLLQILLVYLFFLIFLVRQRLDIKFGTYQNFFIWLF